MVPSVEAPSITMCSWGVWRAATLSRVSLRNRAKLNDGVTTEIVGAGGSPDARSTIGSRVTRVSGVALRVPSCRRQRLFLSELGPRSLRNIDRRHGLLPNLCPLD